MTHIDTFLKTKGYDEPKYDVFERNTIVDLIPKSKRCGIYVLHFSNNEFYIGLSINVSNRYIQHCKTYDDIQFFSFKTVLLNELQAEEKSIIKQAENNGFKLRNKVHTSVTVFSSLFDEIMDEDTQTQWLQGIVSNDFSGERVIDEDLRRKYRRNFQQLTNLPNGNQAVEIFKQYTRQCIPAPIQSELYYWSVSCLPGNSKTLYIRLNIKQEVLRIVNFDHDVECTFFVSKSVYGQDQFLKKLWHIGKQYLKFNAISMGDGMYEAGGQDQTAVSIAGFENAMRVLQNEEFIRAIRSLNLRIMRKSFNLQYRYHCFDLADTALL